MCMRCLEDGPPAGLTEGRLETEGGYTDDLADGSGHLAITASSRGTAGPTCHAHEYMTEGA